MEIAKFIFGKNKTKENRIKKLLSVISEYLADLNEFPNYLPRFQSINANEQCKRITEALSELIEIYKDGINEVGFDKTLEYIKKNFRKIMLFASRDGVITLESLVVQIIVAEVSVLFYSVDDYICINHSQEKVFKKIKSFKLDKYGLITVDDKFQLEKDGIIYDKRYLVYYHQFLRRYYTSNFTELSLYLKRASKDKKMTLKIAIDPKRLTTPKYLKKIIELDYWRGPKFSNKKLNEKKFKGLTVYGRSKRPHPSGVWPVDRTEFFITNLSNSSKEIQIEEINPPEGINYSKSYVLQKYAHILWNTKGSFFSHLDAAVKVYTCQEHIKRFKYEWKPKRINEEANTDEKIKLFRIDGIIDKEFAMNLLGDFYRYNELVKEFFSGE